MAKRNKRLNPPVPLPVPPAAAASRLASLRQNLTTTAIGAVVGGLITISSASGVYLFNARKSMREIQEPVHQELQDDSRQIKLAGSFVEKAKELKQRSAERLNDYFKDQPWQKRVHESQKTRNQALATAALGIEQANRDLGALNAYEGQIKMLPSSFYSASTAVLQAEVGVWNSLTEFAESAAAAGQQKAFDAWVNRWSEWERAAGSFENSRPIVAESLEAESRSETRLFEKERADYEQESQRFQFATGGFAISTCALVLIAAFVAWPTKKPGETG